MRHAAGQATQMKSSSLLLRQPKEMCAVGHVLQQARQSVGLSLPELQQKTGIELSLLYALEKGDFARLPSPFYTRSLLRSYAHSVQLDPHRLLRRYRRYEQAERGLTGRMPCVRPIAAVSTRPPLQLLPPPPPQQRYRRRDRLQATASPHRWLWRSLFSLLAVSFVTGLGILGFIIL